jgi:hypothetical protein
MKSETLRVDYGLQTRNVLQYCASNAMGHCGKALGIVVGNIGACVDPPPPPSPHISMTNL